MFEDTNLKSIAGAIFSCLLWSTAFVGIKIGLKYTSPFFFAGARFTLSGIILFLISGNIKNYFKQVKKHFSTIIKVSLLQTFIVYALFYTGIAIVSGALSAIVIGSSPLTAAVVAHLTTQDDKMSLKKSASIFIGILGIIVIALSRKPWSVEGLNELGGIFLLLLSTISGALGNVAVSKAKKSVPSRILASSQLFLGGLGLLSLSFLVEGLPSISNSPVQFYLALAWLALLSAIAFNIWFHLLKQGIKVSDLNLWKFIIPVFGALLSWILLPNENPTIATLTGMLFVAGSIISYYYHK